MSDYFIQSSRPPLIRIIISALIGICIGYFIFSSTSFTSNQDYKGTICLVIDDFGYAVNETVEEFLDLDENITIAIIPGTPYAQELGKLADNLNIETIVHMPMESTDQAYETDSEFTISEKLNINEIEKRVRMAFTEIPMALGMNNHQGSKATENLQLMKDLARVLKKLDKFFLDSFTHPESRGFITMRRYGVQTQLRQVFLDHTETSAHIHSQLDSLVSLSHSMDVAIGIGHVKPATLSVLKTEIPRLQNAGYRFIKLSQIVN